MCVIFLSAAVWKEVTYTHLFFSNDGEITLSKGQAKAILAGPDPGPQGRATLSLALAPGRLDPGPGGSGQGRVRADPGPWYRKFFPTSKIICINYLHQLPHL